MTAYTLRAIDPELWASVKSRAAADRLPLRSLLLALLRSYAAGQIQIEAHQPTVRTPS